MVERRAEKGWNQQHVFDQVREHFGWGPKSLSLYGDIERGKTDLTGEDKIVLAALYGKVPEDVPEPPQVEATPDLAAALFAIATELREARAERAAVAQKLEEMEAILDGLVERAKPAEDGLHAPHETTGLGR